MADVQTAVAGVWPWSTAVAGVALLLALVGLAVAARRRSRRDESTGLPLLAEQTVEPPRLGGRHRRRRRQPTTAADRRPVAQLRPRNEDRDTITIRIFDPPPARARGGRR